MSARKRFLLRLEPELYEVLQRWAADELRSVNGQMEYLLKQAARRAGRLRPRGAARAPAGGQEDARGSASASEDAASADEDESAVENEASAGKDEKSAGEDKEA